MAAVPSHSHAVIPIVENVFFSTLKTQMNDSVAQGSHVPPLPGLYSTFPRHVHPVKKPPAKLRTNSKKKHIIVPTYSKHQKLPPLAPPSQKLYSTTLTSDEFPDNVSQGTWAHRAVPVCLFFRFPTNIKFQRCFY